MTIIELTDARAKIRYLEADAMIAWRADSLRIKAEAERDAKAKVVGEKAAATPICICGHGADQHETQGVGGAVCMLSGCGCGGYKCFSEPDPSRIVIPKFP